MNLKYLKRRCFKTIKQSKIIFLLYERIACREELRVTKSSYDGATAKSIDTIKREKQAHHNHWRCGDFVYERYGLAYKDLSIEEILNYVPTYYFHKNIEKHHQGIDTVKWGDKLVQARLFEERNIPTAKVIAVVKNGVCWDWHEQKQLDIKQIVNDCLSNNVNKLFFKPTGGCGGAGILVLKRINSQLLLNGECISDIDEFMAKLSSGTYVVEENIIQNSQLSAINPSSVNTLRVVVQKEDGKMVVRTCILRMGRHGKEVDNSTQGGISIKVDALSGEFASSATAEHGAGVIMQHPDTNYQFAGNGIENWDSVKSQIEDIANSLSDFEDIALDIAITEDKVILIEFNFRYGIEHQQCVLGGVRQILNIPNK